MQSTSNRSCRRRLGVGVVAPLLVVAAACGDDDGIEGAAPDLEVVAPADYAATPQFLNSVAERSDVEAFRYEMRVSFTGEPDPSATPMLTAEQNGDQASMHMDLGAMLEQMSGPTGGGMPPGQAGLDMSMDMVVDGTDLYMHMPMMAEVGSMDPGPGFDPGMANALADWAYIDMTQWDDMDALMQSTGGQQVDPAEYLEVLSSATGAEELEPTEVRGTLMTGISATASFGDLYAAQGMDPEDFADAMPGVGDDFMEAEVDLSIWVDSEGRMGRLQYTMDLAALTGSVGMSETEGAQMESMFGGSEITYTMDMFDYGDTSIAVEVPTGATDVTEEYLALPGM